MDQVKELISTIIFGIDTGSLAACLATISSLYIPVAILIYQDFKEKHAFNEFEWDKTVLLQEVIKGQQILGAILISSISVILWNYPNIWVKVALLIIFTAGIVILIKNLVRLFEWFMSNKVGRAKHNNYRQEQKIKFLQGLDPNTSLDVWSNLFGTIELENSYLKDYLKIFFDKFSKTEKHNLWQYEFCLTKNMERLYYWNPDVQKIIVDFAFDVYKKREDKSDIGYCKRTIVQKMMALLAKSNDCPYISATRYFDMKLSNMDDQDIFDAVKNFSFDILQEVLMSYDSIPERKRGYNFEIFPVEKWTITKLPNNKNKRENAKAMGLFVSYLNFLPAYIGMDEKEIKEDRAAFLDMIVFGLSNETISRKIIRVVSIFFNRSCFGVYENESSNHALIRTFIDNDYHFYFIDSSVGVATNYDPNETEEERQERVMKIFEIKENQRDKNTLKLLSQIYRFLLNMEQMDEIAKDISKYDVNDEKYKYKTDAKLLKYNLSELKDVFDKIRAFNKEKQ